MKYLKLYENHQSNQEIHDLCKEYGIKNYTINSDGSIDVDGDVYLNDKLLDKIPLNFNIVSGHFHCGLNFLTSLKGTPVEVGVSFNCSHNKLTSLEGGPKKVGSDFYCNNNFLTSLEGSPIEVGDHFDCSINKLTSLKGSPEIISGFFDCGNNELESLEGGPKEIEYGFYFNCFGNSKLKSLKGCPSKMTGKILAKETKFENLTNLLENKGSYIHYYTTHNKAIHRYGDDTILLPMFNRMLRKFKLDEVQTVRNFKIIRTKQEGEEYLNRNK